MTSRLIDQDQSDNVVTTYLINGNGQTAQNTAANATAIAGATTLVNGSDDKLLAAFVDPANGCTPFTAPDTTDPNGTSGSQALNELSARVNQQGTIAVVPPNDEMTLVDAAFSIAKTNVYRSLVDQPLLAGNINPTQVAASYCQNMTNIAPARNQLDMTREQNFGTPVAAVGNNLATFLGNRLSMSFVNLGCANFGLANPVTVTLDGNRVATAVTYNTAQQAAKLPAAATPTPSASATVGTGGPRRRNRGPADQAPSVRTQVPEPVPYVAVGTVQSALHGEVAPRKLGAISPSARRRHRHVKQSTYWIVGLRDRSADRPQGAAALGECFHMCDPPLG